MEEEIRNDLITSILMFINSPNQLYFIDKMIEDSKSNTLKAIEYELQTLLREPNQILIEQVRTLKNKKESFDNSYFSTNTGFPYINLLNELKAIVEETKSNKNLSEYIQYLISLKNISTDSEIYKAANFSRDYWSTLINGVKTNPSKNRLLRLAMVLELNNSELDALLKKAGYTLKDDERDSIIHVIFKKNIYDIEIINSTLIELEFEQLYDNRELLNLGLA